MPPPDEIPVERRARADRVPRRENAQESRQAKMNEHASLDTQTGQLWMDMTAWLSSHSLQIILGFAAAVVIVLVLLGIKWVGVRICGTDPDNVHWRTVLGRVLAGSRLWFMIAFAGR